MAPINVGILGYGFATKCFHLPFILPNPELNVYAFLQRAAAPEDPSTAKKGDHCTVDHPSAKHYRTPEEFFADDNIDLVIVATRHDTHASFAELALKSGKHVVVEKPFTRTTEEADRLIALAKEKGKILTVFQNRRYDSDFRTLYHLASQKAFGQLTDIELHYDVDFPFWIQKWKATEYAPGDGMMFGLGSHSVDQALLLVNNQTPTHVTGYYRVLRGCGGNVDDTFAIVLQFDGEYKDLIMTIKTSVVTPMDYPLKYLVRGYGGSFLKYGDDPQERQIMGGMKATDSGFGQEEEATYGLLCTKEKFDDKIQKFNERTQKWQGYYPSLKGDYEGYYKDVAKAVKGEGEVIVKAEQSRNGIRVIELARESAEKNQTLPFS